MHKGNKLVPGGEFWAVDSDMKVLGSCEAEHTIHISAEEEASVPPAELRRLVGASSAGAAAVKVAAPMPAQATAGVLWRVILSQLHTSVAFM